MKEKENIKESPYLCGYVARDKNGLLHVFEVKPMRCEDYWWDIVYFHFYGIRSMPRPAVYLRQTANGRG